jgi:hypothetical protein
MNRASVNRFDAFKKLKRQFSRSVIIPVETEAAIDLAGATKSEHLTSTYKRRSQKNLPTKQYPYKNRYKSTA